MIAVAAQCRCGHTVEVSENDAIARKCCCGFLEPDECPACQESLAIGAGIDTTRPGGIPSPDHWDYIMFQGTH